MSHEGRVKKILKSLNGFFLFFFLTAFIVTCCSLLFLQVMTRQMQLELVNENVQLAAKLTFLNVLILSLLISIVDAVRRKITVERPAKKIIDAAEKIMMGDFTVRIPKTMNLAADDKFNEIAEYINRMAEELSHTETLRTDFIANVSHELKTPLSVMQNYGTLLQSPGLSEEKRKEYAKAITDASRRMASLITNILKLNKLENQQILPVTRGYDLSEQVCECLLGFEEIWERKEINIETDIEDEIMVRSDPEMMNLVWNNLFSNAMKFTEKGGTVSLTVKKEADYAVVRISDTGCGISKEVGAHMFDKFYQGDTSHATQGNGLGLALVKRIIDLTGSDISVESELGKGTVFTVKMWRGQDEGQKKVR